MSNSHSAQHPIIQYLKTLNIKTFPPTNNTYEQKQNQSFFCNFYGRGGLLKSLKKNILPTTPTNMHAERILDQHFTYSLNPIYEKLHRLPHKIFFCGYCKQPFYGPCEYTLHCLEEQCPINHNRSTYFFQLKGKYNLIKNTDILTVLTQSQLKLLKSLSYRKRKILFAQHQVRALKSDSKQFLYCGKCGLKKVNSGQKRWNNYRFHCILDCKSTKIPTNSHSFKILQFDQKLLEFFQDVLNFVLNYNMICFFEDSYLRLQKNPKFKPSSPLSHYCANCKIQFSKSSDYFQHVMLDCIQKPSSSCSHFFERKRQLKLNEFQKIDENQIERQEKQGNTETGLKRKQIKQESGVQLKERKEQCLEYNNTIWEDRVNNELRDFKDLLENIYFCSQCQGHFQNSRDFLAHCYTYFCPVNNNRNSHYFLAKFTGQELQRKQLKGFFSNLQSYGDSNKIKDNPKLDKILTENIVLIDNSTNLPIKPRKINNYHCGKCGQKFGRQNKFINHVVNVCFSQDKYNSHRIQMVNQSKMNDIEFRRFFNEYMYAIQIVRLNPKKRYCLRKNMYVDTDPDYLCGKCDTLFESKYEYILHSVQVCQNMKSKNSSHYITYFHSNDNSEVLQNPLAVVKQLAGQKNNQRKTQCPIKDFAEDQIQYNKPIQIEQHLSQSQKVESKQLSSKLQPSHLFKAEILAQNHIDKSEEKEQQKNNKRALQQIQDSSPMRFLRHNIDFDFESNQKYYCGACQVSFRKEFQMIEHLNQCGNCQEAKSSHFYITNQKYKQKYVESMLTSSNYLKNGLKTFSEFENDDNQTYVCGCGQIGPLKKFSRHLSYAHANNVPKGSSHVIFRIGCRLSSIGFVIVIPLSVNKKNVDPQYKFNCPCNPWVSYSYEKFVNHLMKRHSGKSPKLIMKSDEA